MTIHRPRGYGLIVLGAVTVILTIFTSTGWGTVGQVLPASPENESVVMGSLSWSILTTHSTHLVETASAATHPSARFQASITYDAADGYVLLFGGGGISKELNDTWTYHAGVWKELFPAVSPPARRAAGMTYDAADGYVVLFGGSYNNSNAGSSDTWMFKAGVWTQLFPSVSPPARAGASMVYDNATKSVIMFSGTSNWCCSNAGLHDMWSFKNGTWAQLTLSTNPSQRNEYGFSYDSLRHAAVMFGGWIPGGSAGTLTSQTWLYKAGNWISHPTPGGLSPRQGPAQSYDPLLNESIIFGGTANNGIFFGSTWSFNATGWHHLSAFGGPGKRAFAAMTFDAADGYILLFGGSGPKALLGDTWSFNATGWQRLSYSDGLG